MNFFIVVSALLQIQSQLLLLGPLNCASILAVNPLEFDHQGLGLLLKPRSIVSSVSFSLLGKKSKLSKKSGEIEDDEELTDSGGLAEVSAII